jgi:NTE family protein
MNSQAGNTFNEVDGTSPRRPLVAVMSSGFFGFFAHAGFLQGLEDLGLQPDAYAGASSGALVAASAAAGVKPLEMLDIYQKLRREQFWDPPKPAEMLKLILKRFRGRTGYLAGQAFARLLERDLPVKHFEECAKPCLIVALDTVGARRVVFTRGPLIPAIVASGAVPVMFNAVEHDGQLLLDGGLVDKAPLMASLEHLGAASMAVHYIPSDSITKPIQHTLKRNWTPLKLQARAIDASRRQVYEDQMAQVRAAGVSLCEVKAEGQIRVGPKRLHLGKQAFDQARERAIEAFRAHKWS